MTVFFSVVVCTHNRSEMLKGCLESLSQQTLDKRKYEVIVVDNNSSDDTRQVTEGFLGRVTIRHVLETRLGLCPARNRGLKEAQGEYVAYIDDDARAALDWLEVAEDVIETQRPRLDVLGGPYYPFYTSPKPDWFDDKYEIRSLGDSSKYLDESEYISGSNMIWEKSILQKIGGFNDAIGIVGNNLRLGDEANTIKNLRLDKDQPRIYFSPDLVIYHWVPKYKMNVSYRLKRRFAEGQYYAYEADTEGGIHTLKLIADLACNVLISAIRFLIKAVSHRYWQGWIVEDGGRVAFYLGKALGLLGIQPKVSRVN